MQQKDVNEMFDDDSFSFGEGEGGAEPLALFTVRERQDALDALARVDHAVRERDPHQHWTERLALDLDDAPVDPEEEADELDLVDLMDYDGRSL